MTNNQLPVTSIDDGSYTVDREGAPLGTTLSGANSFSALYNYDWSALQNQYDSTSPTYEEAGFMGANAAPASTPQTRQFIGALMDHYYLNSGNTMGAPVGYYVQLAVAYGSVGITNFGYTFASPDIYLGNSLPTETLQLAFGFNSATNNLTANLYDGSGNLLGGVTANAATMKSFGSLFAKSADE